ncbi:MAG: FIG00503159: hypothetical protein, partial [uncultured Thermomicrobiales bacterium]
GRDPVVRAQRRADPGARGDGPDGPGRPRHRLRDAEANRGRGDDLPRPPRARQPERGQAGVRDGDRSRRIRDPRRLHHRHSHLPRRCQGRRARLQHDLSGRTRRDGRLPPRRSRARPDRGAGGGDGQRRRAAGPGRGRRRQHPRSAQGHRVDRPGRAEDRDPDPVCHRRRGPRPGHAGRIHQATRRRGSAAGREADPPPRRPRRDAAAGGADAGERGEAV